MLSPDLERFFELSPDLCCVLAKGAIQDANAAWLATLGYASQELVEQRFIDLVHADDRATTEGELAKRVRASFSARCRRKDGTYRAVRWVSLASRDARAVYLIGRAEPTTISRAERLLSLGQVAVGVVHDLKNVLVHPLGLYAQRIERAIEANDPARAQEAIESLNITLREGLEAIDRVLQFSRPCVEPRRTQLDLDDVAWRASEIARAYARSLTPIREVHIAYEPGKANPIPADAFELLTAIVNVLFNAIDAVTDGGKVCVRTGNGDAHAWIEVIDDGPGMSEDVRARIFEPFFTTKPDGMGIGLAMVEACVDRHAGAMRLTTAPGTGTTFRIELPFN